MIAAKCAVVKCDQCDTPMFLMLESQKSQKYNVKVKDIKVQIKRHVSLLSKSKSCNIKSKTAKRQNSKAKEVVVLLMPRPWGTLVGIITCNTNIRSTPNSAVLYTNANAYQSYKVPQRGLIAWFLNLKETTVSELSPARNFTILSFKDIASTPSSSSLPGNSIGAANRFRLVNRFSQVGQAVVVEQSSQNTCPHGDSWYVAISYTQYSHSA